MKRALTAIAAEIPDLIRNTSISVALEGWPAAIAISVACISAVAVAAICAESEAITD